MIVTILDGCTGCGACEAINSEVFHVDRIAHVDPSKVSGNERDCLDAAMICPTNSIWIEDL